MAEVGGGVTNFRLDGKVAVVTGGAGGIGAAYAQALGEAGAAVALADIDAAGAQTAAKSLSQAGMRAMGVGIDITDEQSARDAAARVSAEFGGIDILVNNAALMRYLHRTPLLELDLDEWDRVMAVNVKGALICARAAVPSMIGRGGGKIINQSSGGAWAGPPNFVHYAVSKIAIVGLTHGMAREFGEHNIQVNAIAPGAVETEAGLELTGALPGRRAEIGKRTALHGSAPPEDVCGTLVFLASPASDWMTGQTLNVDGGWVYRY